MNILIDYIYIQKILHYIDNEVIIFDYDLS